MSAVATTKSEVMNNAVELSQNAVMAIAKILTEDRETFLKMTDGMTPAQVKEAEAKLQNIGNVGIAPDYSNNQLRNPLQNEFPLAMWLLSTPLAIQMRNAFGRGYGSVYNDGGEWYIQLPFGVYTLPPEDTTGQCCWVPFNLSKCADREVLRLLCLKDCYDMLDTLISRNRYPGSNDLTGWFQRPGESVEAARIRMARTSMAFFTAKTLILGLLDAETTTTKPFHGLLDVLEDEAVIHIDGSNILGAMASLYCRITVMDGGSYVFWTHPLTLASIDEQIQPGKFGTLPRGWARNGNNLTYRGIAFRTDKNIPYDPATGLGEVWMLDGETVGALLGTDLYPTSDFIFEQWTHNNAPADGCAEKCTYMYNYGTVANTNPNRLAVIVNVSGSANCMGNALQGLTGLINPDTLVPR